MRVVRATLDPRPDLLPSAADVDDAVFEAARIHAGAGISRVALARVPSLDERAGGVRVWLAIESLQVTGSFKVRGAHRALLQHARKGASAVVAASAGNHGAGVAYVAQKVGIRATIVVPAATPEKKLDNIASYGAELVPNEGGYDAAERAAMKLAEERGVPFVSPYDDVDVLLGNGATLAAEIHEQLGEHAATAIVVAPFGGGGLATGLACGFARALRSAPGEDRRVWGVQTEASPSFALSLERGSAVESYEGTETRAEGLEGGIPERAFLRAAGVVAGVAVVSEASLAQSMRFGLRDLGLVLEGSAAVALVPLLEGRVRELDDRASEPTDVVSVLTGRNVDPSRLVW